MQAFPNSKLLIGIIGISFLFILGYAITGPLRPLYIVEVGATTIQLGLIMAVPSIVSIFTRIPSSALSNKIGRWNLMFISLILSLIATALFAFILHPLWFFPVVALAALAWSMFSPIAVEYVSSQSTPDTRGGTMGLYFTSIGAAMFVGPLISSVLTIYLNLRGLFLVSALFPFIAIIGFLLMIKKSEIDRFVTIDESGLKVDGTWGSFNRFLRERNFIVLCFARIAYAFSMAIFTTVYPVYAEKSLGFTPSLISLLFTFRGVTNVLIRMPAGRLSDKIGRRKPFIIAYVFAIVVFLLLARVDNFNLLLLVMALFGIGWGMRVAPSTALLSESVSFEDRPLALATFMTMWDVGSTIGSLVAGFATVFFSPSLLLLICVPVMVIPLLIFVSFSKEVHTH